jgi:hypothetical protein
LIYEQEMMTGTSVGGLLSDRRSLAVAKKRLGFMEMGI